MNLVIVSNAFPNSSEPQRGLFTYQIVKELRQICNLDVVAPLPWIPKGLISGKDKKFLHANVPDHEELDGIMVYHPRYIVIPKVSGFLHAISMYFPLLKCLQELDEEHRIDVINAHWVYPDGVAAVWAGRRLQRAVVLTALGCDVNLYATMLLRRLQIRRAIKRSDVVTAVGDGLKEAIVGLSISSESVRVIRNGINLEMFHIMDKNVCKRKLMLPEGKQIILTVGSQDEVKGTCYLIDAFAELVKTMSGQYLLVLIGEGPLHPELVQQARALGVTENVVFAGSRPHAEIPLWMNAADVFCLPSLREGHPNVVIEALACGTPVVASKVGEIPEMVNDQSGLTVAIGDARSLSLALTEVLRRDWPREVIRAGVEGFDWRQCADLYHKAYIEAAAVFAAKNM